MHHSRRAAFHCKGKSHTSQWIPKTAVLWTSQKISLRYFWTALQNDDIHPIHFRVVCKGLFGWMQWKSEGRVEQGSWWLTVHNDGIYISGTCSSSYFISTAYFQDVLHTVLNFFVCMWLSSCCYVVAMCFNISLEWECSPQADKITWQPGSRWILPSLVSLVNFSALKSFSRWVL